MNTILDETPENSGKILEGTVKRRGFLGILAALPFLGFLRSEPRTLKSKVTVTGYLDEKRLPSNLIDGASVSSDREVFDINDQGAHERLVAHWAKRMDYHGVDYLISDPIRPGGKVFGRLS